EQLKDKDVHIANIEAELTLIKNSNSWRYLEFYRKIIYNKLPEKFPLLKNAILTLKNEGISSFYIKMIGFLNKNKNIASFGMIKNVYDHWLERNSLSGKKAAEINKEIASFSYKPRISIIMPVYNVDETWLEKAIISVIDQAYSNWELCIADDASTRKHIRKLLNKYSAKDKRIKVKYLQKNMGISGASNEALSIASGEYVGLLDNDDELTKDALYEYVKLLNQHQDAELIYSDEDKIDVNGKQMEPFFKPDYSPDLLLSMNYICHFSMFKRLLLNKIGGFRLGYEGSQDYDLILRYLEKTRPDRIFHIPKILYHWRKIPGSAAAVVDAKNYAFISAKNALSDYLERNKIEGEVTDGIFLGSYRVKRSIKSDSKISIIIPFRDKVTLL
ncbi:glycosyltransferase, partial [Desulfobacterales bacterium HSG17]|nr:glycosyltransferase [Desulfobacterales bacterium HSG17]